MTRSGAVRRRAMEPATEASSRGHVADMPRRSLAPRPPDPMTRTLIARLANWAAEGGSDRCRPDREMGPEAAQNGHARTPSKESLAWASATATG